MVSKSSSSLLLLFFGILFVTLCCVISTSEASSSKSDHRLRLLSGHLSSRSFEQSSDEKNFVSAFVRDPKDRVLVSLELRDNYRRSEAVPLSDLIASSGGEVAGTINDRIIEAYIPLSLLSELEAHNHVHYITLVPPFMTSNGKANSQSGAVLGISGGSASGVKVGILSDSVNKCPSPYNASKIGLAGSIATGDLPVLTQHVILKDSSSACGSVKDEGRAMAEIIYDLAPGVKFYYYMPSSPSDYATGIRVLAENGCKIIVDDIRFIGDPVFQDSVVAQAVDSVTAEGVSYFSAAGNVKNAAYQANFTVNTSTNFNLAQVGGAASKALVCHKFPSGSSFLPLGAAANVGKIVQFILNWAVPYKSLGGPTNPIDLDLIISSKATTPPTVLSVSGLSHGTDPWEYAPSTINANTQLSICVSSAVVIPSGQTYGTYVKYNGAPVQFRLMYNQVGLGILSNAPTVMSQQNALGAITVGAIGYSQSCRSTWNSTGCVPVIESYSSLGGTTIYYNSAGAIQKSIRAKPDVTGPDCGFTSFFPPGFVTPALPSFCGTSAAAPALAAFGARIAARCPSISSKNMKSLIKNAVTDIPPAGFDYYSGTGLPLWSKVPAGCPA